MRDFVAAAGLQQRAQRLQWRANAARVLPVDRLDLLGVVVVDEGLDGLDGGVHRSRPDHRGQRPGQPTGDAPQRQQPAAVPWRQQRLDRGEMTRFRGEMPLRKAAHGRRRAWWRGCRGRSSRHPFRRRDRSANRETSVGSGSSQRQAPTRMTSASVRSQTSHVLLELHAASIAPVRSTHCGRGEKSSQRPSHVPKQHRCCGRGRPDSVRRYRRRRRAAWLRPTSTANDRAWWQAFQRMRDAIDVHGGSWAKPRGLHARGSCRAADRPPSRHRHAHAATTTARRPRRTSAAAPVDGTPRLAVHGGDSFDGAAMKLPVARQTDRALGPQQQHPTTAVTHRTQGGRELGRLTRERQRQWCGNGKHQGLKVLVDLARGAMQDPAGAAPSGLLDGRAQPNVQRPSDGIRPAPASTARRPRPSASRFV